MLRFSPLTTFDLRFFANLGDDLSLLVKHPWLRGSSIRLEATNIFNARQNVRDPFGTVPLGDQPDLIDPLGRTISISFRKLFVPRRFIQRQRAPQSQPTGLDLGLLRALERFDDYLARGGGIAPLADPYPLLGLQILIVGEEMLDLLQHDAR